MGMITGIKQVSRKDIFLFWTKEDEIQIKNKYKSPAKVFL